MDYKPSKDEMREFKEHKVWRWLEVWLNQRKEDAKNKLITVKTMEEVIGLQQEYEAFKKILDKINKF